MDEITKAITSPVWLFSTIFIALLVNLLSAYLVPLCDNLISKFNIAWKVKSQNNRREFASAVNKLVASPQALAEAAESEIRRRLQAIVFILLTMLQTLFIVLVRILQIDGGISSRTLITSLLSLMLLTLVLSITCNSSASRKATLVLTARRILINNEK